MNLMKYIINRRKFLGLFGCSCCTLLMPSCATVPITERKQLSLIPEAKINLQAAKAYAQFKNKAKLITKGKQLEEIKTIGKKLKILLQPFLKIVEKKILRKLLDGIMS